MSDEHPPDLDEPELDEEQSRRMRQLAIDNCTMCDPDGYRHEPKGIVCHHNPRQDEINRRGIEQVRAVLGPRKPGPQPVSHDLVDVVARQRDAGPPQPITDEEEPEL
jgi:hypothetical protein